MKKTVILFSTLIILISSFMFFYIVKANQKELNSEMEIQTTIVGNKQKACILLKLYHTEEINTYQSKIQYDENIWEPLTENSFTVKGNWTQLKYNQDNHNFILINKEGSTQENEIVEITLITKENISSQATELRIENIVASDGNVQFTKEPMKQEVKIKLNNTSSELTNEQTDNTSSELTNEQTGNTSSELTNEQTDNIATGTLPQTGETSILPILIVAILALAMLFLWKYKKLKNMILLLLIGMISITSCNRVLANSTLFLGDINQSSLLDDEDIELLEEHLISLKSLTQVLQADMNEDREVTIMDLSLLIKQQKECPYDKYNVTNISQWQSLPMVSKELLEHDEVTTGGEGCQWPIGMAISKDGNLLLLGTDVGGMYRSTDGGKNWEQSNAGLASRGVGAIAIDPKNPSYVIAIGINSNSFDTNGPHISEDGGQTWKHTKSILITGHRDIRDSITFDESSYKEETNRCMIAYWSTAYQTEKNQLTPEEKGLYQTTDGGYTWNLINSELCDGIIKINPYTGEVYVAKSEGIYYSKDKGTTFTNIIQEEITGFDLVSQNGKTYLYYCNHDGIYQAQEENHFTKIDSENYPTDQPMNLKVSPIDRNKMIIINKEGEYQNYSYYSENGGITWQKSVLDNTLSFMPYNNRASIPMWSPVENKVWLFIQGDFVSSSIDSGKTFQWDSNGITGILSGGLVHYNVYNPNIIYFGSQDYNGCVTTDGGKTWKYINMAQKGWGGFCYGGYAVDENTYFVGVAEGWNEPRKLKITFDGGKTIVDTGLYFTQENLRTSIESSYQSPTNPDVLFACDLRSEDGGHTWKKMKGCINVYTHNPKGQKELYGMDETAKYVVVSYDNGITWEKVNKEKLEQNTNSHTEGLSIDDIAYDWKHECVYVAAGNRYLYKVSTQNGSIEYVINQSIKEYNKAPSNIKGTNIITKVAVDPNDPNIVYCGGPGNYYMNDCSLYRSVDGGKTFQVVTSNTTNTIIKAGKQGGFETNSIEVNPQTGELLFAGGCFGLSKLSPPY